MLLSSGGSHLEGPAWIQAAKKDDDGNKGKILAKMLFFNAKQFNKNIRGICKKSILVHTYIIIGFSWMFMYHSVSHLFSILYKNKLNQNKSVENH